VETTKAVCILVSLSHHTGSMTSYFGAMSLENSNEGPAIYLTENDGIDFVTLHNLLYYIYTGYANISSLHPFSNDENLPEGYPKEPDPFLLFQNAKKFLLPELAEFCLYELENDITDDNVASRLFHPCCKENQDLRELYFAYLVKNYEKVKDTDGWKRAYEFGSANESLPMKEYRMNLLFDISRKFLT
jgi:hypothetical protein